LDRSTLQLRRERLQAIGGVAKMLRECVRTDVGRGEHDNAFVLAGRNLE
jgi:hypothetical protein